MGSSQQDWQEMEKSRYDAGNQSKKLHTVNAADCVSDLQTVKIKRNKEHAMIPKYAHATDSGMDLYACLEGEYSSEFLEPGERKLFPTGISIEVPHNMEAQVRPRSGWAVKNGVTVLNTPGTIDSGYRGEIGVLLINHGKHRVAIASGDRIAQLVIAPITKVALEVVDTISESDRGFGGFGSTGK